MENMSEFIVSCHHEGKIHKKTIQAKNDKQFYIKNCPRTIYTIKDGYTRCHPEMLDQVHRDIEFMDRTGLIASGFCDYMQGLEHKRRSYSRCRYTPIEENWKSNPKSIGFDHTTVWRTKGERWPLLVLTEPYNISKEEIQKFDDICDNSDYRYRVFPPSKESLWNDHCYMIFWWSAAFYEPDFKALMPNSWMLPKHKPKH